MSCDNNTSGSLEVVRPITYLHIYHLTALWILAQCGQAGESGAKEDQGGGVTYLQDHMGH